MAKAVIDREQIHHQHSLNPQAMHPQTLDNVVSELAAVNSDTNFVGKYGYLDFDATDSQSNCFDLLITHYVSQ